MCKPTVLIVDNSIDTTGAFNAIFSFVQYVQADYHFVFVLPAKSRIAEKIKAQGFVVETLPFLEISKRLYNLIFYLPRLLANAIRLNRLVRKYNARLVHVNDFYNLTGAAAKVLGGRFPLITHVRFMPDRFPALLVSLWMSSNLRYANAIICVSQAVKRCLHDHPKIHVIYDGICYREPATIITQYPKEEEIINLLYLAHYIPGKGQDLALEAFRQAFVQNPKLRLKFVGGDMGLSKNKVFREKLVSRSKELGLQDVVSFYGPVSDVTQVLARADIVLNFSESESFSMTCLEALMVGKPLVATDCGGPAELFIHQKSGWLVPNLEVKAMKEAIITIANDEMLRQKLSHHGPIYVKYKFARKNTMKKLQEVYSSLIHSGKVISNKSRKPL